MHRNLKLLLNWKNDLSKVQNVYNFRLLKETIDELFLPLVPRQKEKKPNY